TARDGNVAIADAMATAVRRHLDGPTPRPLLHPRFWAALVVVGDGSISLSTSTSTASRILGPFAYVDAADHAAIISTASLETDFAVSAIGQWTGKEFESLIRRETIDGTIKWETKNPQVSVGRIVATGTAIYAGGGQPDGASPVTVPVLRSLQPDGKILWTQSLQDVPGDA